MKKRPCAVCGHEVCFGEVCAQCLALIYPSAKPTG